MIASIVPLIFTSVTASAMIGGTAVRSAHEVFFGHCTGTIIAPHLILTAGHCVAQDGLFRWRYGDPIYVRGYTGSDFSTGRVGFQTSIAKIHVHPSWIRFRPAEPGPERDSVADVAVIVLANQLPLPAAHLPKRPRLEENQSIRVFGAGCEIRRDHLSIGRLKEARLKTLAVSANEVVVGTFDEVTQKAAGLCKLDSGGGAFNNSGEVVAVNSWIGVSHETADAAAKDPEPIIAHLARVDRYEILEWLSKNLESPLPADVAVNTEPQTLIEALGPLYGTDRGRHPAWFLVSPYLQRDQRFGCLRRRDLRHLAKAIRRGEGESLEAVLDRAPNCTTN